MLEIKIGTERNQVKEISNGYSLNKEDEDSISYKLFKIYDDLETGEDDIELELFCIISRKSGQKIQKIANLQYYKSKANYGTKKKGISR